MTPAEHTVLERLELASAPQWLLWRFEADPSRSDGKPTKIPYRPDVPRRHASSTAPETWGTLAEALDAREKSDADGTAFVFSPSDPFAGIDVDDCRDPETGRLTADAAAIVSSLDSYAEASPSGTGVHVIVRGKKLVGSRSKKDNLEIYDHSRFFCMTGRHVRGTPSRIEELLGGWWGESDRPADDELVFPGKGHDGYLSSSTLTRRVLYPALERAGVPRVGPTGEQRTFHSLRHTFARIALENGRDLPWLSRYLGHSSVAVTERHYGHFDRSAHTRHLEALDAVFTTS